MYGISKMVLKKRHGIEDERASLFEETRKWMSEGVGQSGGKFCGGDSAEHRGYFHVWRVQSREDVPNVRGRV